MAEATWGNGTKTPAVDWRMSAALENVPRGDSDLAEVTSLEGAVQAWSQLDEKHRAVAVLKLERTVQIDGVASQLFHADGIARLAELLAVSSRPAT